MITHNTEETKNIAAEFAATLNGGEVVLLVGDLGTGKTTFVQGVAEALGVAGRVKSPTFTVMNEYAITARPAVSRSVQCARLYCTRGSTAGRASASRLTAIHRIVHLDLFRFTNENELRALALEDERRPDTVVFIEWPNAITHAFDADHVVTLTHAGGDNRSVTITAR